MFVFVFVSFSSIFFLQGLKEGVLTCVEDLNWVLRDGCHFCIQGVAGRKFQEVKTTNND